MLGEAGCSHVRIISGMFGVAREPQLETGAPPRCIDQIQGTAVIVRDLAAEMEPEAGPLADFAGGEERIEDALGEIGRNPGAAVGHDDLDPFPVGARGDADPPPFARRTQGVVEQVQEDLVQRRRSPQDLARNLKSRSNDTRWRPVREQPDGGLDPLVRVPGLEPPIAPSDVQQITDQASNLIAGVDGDLHRRQVVGIALQLFQIAMHRAQAVDDGVGRIAHLVRQPRRQRPQHRQLLGVHALLGGGAQLRGPLLDPRVDLGLRLLQLDEAVFRGVERGGQRQRVFLDEGLQLASVRAEVHRSVPARRRRSTPTSAAHDAVHLGDCDGAASQQTKHQRRASTPARPSGPHSGRPRRRAPDTRSPRRALAAASRASVRRRSAPCAAGR